jgi:CRP/FNR family transcriptional regulator, cyclic AMP receptor protein
MKERFEGTGRPTLLETIRRQEIVGGNTDIALAFADKGTLVETAKGEAIIKEGGEDNDLFLLIAGSVAIVAKGTQVATRVAGQHVGEMAAIEPTLKRSASVISQDTLVSLKISSADFSEIGTKFPQIWRPLAQELSRRLHQRNDLLTKPNERPKVFIISSAEALDPAYEVATQLERVALCTVWTNGVFFAGGYTLEALERAVLQSDFAVAIAQPDDIVETRKSIHSTVRDNVVFELGLFMGHLTRHRAILLHPRVDDLKLPSDLHGLTLVSYEANKAEDLSARLTPACNHIRKLIQSLGVRTFQASYS